jgi:hypothetical protein
MVSNIGGLMMKRPILFAYLVLALAAVPLVGLFPQSGNASTNPSVTAFKEVYTGNLVYLGGSRGAVTTTFTMTIDSYTPDADVVRLTKVLADGKQDALLSAIGNQKLGTIQIDTNVGQDINAVWVTTGEEGERKITALSKRWIGVFEARRGTRSLDYPFTYIELFVDEKGKGEGGMIPAAKVRAIGDKNIEVENFGIYPARLTNVRRRNK